MKLIQARITDYKIVEDSTPFSIDQVTCLVGKNESGKSAILQALEKLNPIEKNRAAFHEDDYPRRRLSQAQESGEQQEANVLTTVWTLDPNDIEVLTENFYINPLKSDRITITKGYKNSNQWDIKIDDKALVEAYIHNSELNEQERGELTSIASIQSLITTLAGLPTRSETQEKLLTLLKEDFKRGTASLGAIDLLSARLPKFIYFTEYSRMPGRASLDETKRLKAANTLQESDKVFLAFLDLANTSLEQFTTIGTSEQLYVKLEAVSNRITDEIFEFWTQNRHLEVAFKFDQARPDDPAPFNSGMVFNTRITNTRHRASVNFAERSTGFVWFFSFLVWFSQVKKQYGENLFILLDEPGLALHARAQADLLRYMNERLKPSYQVIYTTHSPFMVDPENLLSARTVEDRVSVNAQGKEVIEGTRVGGEILSTDSDTIMPLQGALGYDITQTLFVGANTLLVEGPSDILYIKAMSNELNALRRVGLSPKWTLAPAGGLDKVYSFVSLFAGRKLHTAVIADVQKGDKGKLQRLREHKVLQANHVLTLDTYTNQDEADIEDLIGRDAYIELVRKTYDLKASDLPSKKPVDAPIRCVKEVEDKFCLLVNKPDFDHYTPAQYFVEHIAEFRAKLSGWDEALNRFESLFKEANALLPS